MTPVMRQILLSGGITKRGLLAWYDFKQGADADVLYDKSGNGHHGQLGSAAGSDTNDGTWDATGITEGADDFILFPDNALLKPVAFTLCGVVKLNDATAAGRPCFTWANIGQYYPGFYLNTSVGKVTFFGDSGPASRREWNNSFTDLKWHFYSITMPGNTTGMISNCILKVDGITQAVSSTTDSGNQSSKYAPKLHYGLSGTLAPPLQSMAAQGLWASVLSDGEIERVRKYFRKLVAARGVII